MTARWSAEAPAKVNLYLHVGPPDAAGYHPLSSLVVFADLGDRLSAEPAEDFAFAVTGPFAEGLGGEDNLVVRGLRLAAQRRGSDLPPLALTLHKHLPVAAGLGGGSSDAAAALKLVREAAWPDLTDAEIVTALADLGADGPMCFHACAAIAEGRGERLSPAPALPPLHAVLVNPGVECPTGAIYRAYDAAGRFGGEARGGLRPAYATAAELAAELALCRNDLEAPAVAHAPEVGEALEWLRGRPETLLARLSGSGATSFALCADGASAAALAKAARDERPRWWTRQSCLY